jgi:mono/diheme cytochrome c family protein
MQTMFKNRLPHYSFLLAGFIFSLFLLSCSSAASEGTPTITIPTLTPFPTFQFNAPTQPPQLATVAAATAAAASRDGQALDPERVSRGHDRYIALKCGSCHGENGEGTDEGVALVDMRLSEEDFITLLRSGGSIGSSHQYASNRLSDSGGRNIYQYLLSLQTE